MKIMKKKIACFCLGTASILFLSGCATTVSKTDNEPIAKSEVEKNDLELVDMKMKQLLAIAETSLELSKKADETSQEALVLSKQAKESTDTALEASKVAIEHADETSDKAIQAANKAIETANLASEQAIAVSNQTMAEVNRLRATIKMQEEIKPILKEEPAVVGIGRNRHIVKQGETLSSIAYNYYKDSSKWKMVYEANRSILKNPDIITAGTELIIP